MAAFTIKQGDTRPVYDVTLYDFYGTPSQVPIDLTLATSVSMIMKATGAAGALKFKRAMTFVDKPLDICRAPAAPVAFMIIETDVASVKSMGTWLGVAVEVVESDIVDRTSYHLVLL